MTKSIYSCVIISITTVLCQKLVLDLKDGNYFSDWTVMKPLQTPYVSNYLTQQIFGGQNIFRRLTQIQRMIPYLPEHDTIIIKFQIQVWDSTMVVNYLELYVDDQIKSARIYTVSYPEIQQFTFTFSHSSISALINMQPSSAYQWGLYYFQLYIDKVNLDNLFLKKIGMDYALIGNDLTSTEGWKDSNQLSIIRTCADFSTIFPSTLTSLINTFDIPECDYFSIYFKVFFPTLSTLVYITVETYETSMFLSSSNSFSCSESQMDYFRLYQVSFEKIKIPYMRNVKIIILLQSSTFGLRDFEIHYFKYETIPPLIMGCSQFYNEQCLNCIEGWNYINSLHICQPICGDGKIQYQEQCDDGNNVPYDGCYNCKFQCQLNCKECVFGKCKIFYQNEIQISSFSCNQNPLIYNLFSEQQKKFCNSLCGNGFVDPLEECDDYNNYLYDGCHQCKFSCPLNCKVCVQGTCYLCNLGYQLQNNNYCSPICGDNIKQNEEECDDGNIILFDGCHKCQNNCKVGCQECLNSYCLKCMDGWNFNNGECEQICGDYKVAILSQEQCDSTNFQVCINCQQQCGPYCMYCTSYSNCYQCFNNILLSNGECIPYCGDGIVTDTEQCDDFNDESNDGCFNCRLECKLGCLECQTYDTCDVCDSEFFYLDQATKQCILFPQTDTPDSDPSEYSVISNGNAATDNGDTSLNNGNTSSGNGNTSPNNDTSWGIGQNNSTLNNSTQNNSSLSNPFYSYGLNLSESTIKLSELICKDHHIFLDGNCVSLCGNGILETDYEECDDGNQNGGDGCSFECFVEDSFKCINSNNSMSQCTFLTKPNFVLKLLSEKKSAIQIVEISFSQKVKLASEVFFEEIISLTLTPNIEVILNITPIVNASLELDDVLYNVMIEFQQSIESPQLEVQMMRSNFFSESDQELQNFKQSITLGSPFVLSKQTQNQVNQIVQMNTAMMYSMVGISGLAVLTGNVVLFFNMLDLLQQLSYLRFMQYEFPQHLRQFLESFSKISLKPLLDQLKIDEYIAKINGGKLPFQSKSNQQQQNQNSVNNNSINYYYIMNAKSCYISLLVSFLTYLISSFIISRKFQNFLNDSLLQSTQKYSVSLISKLHQIKYQISLKCYQIKSNYIFTGLFQCYFAILHQFLYSCFLQFPDYDFTTPFNCVNSINAIGAIFLVLYICFKSFSIPSLSNKNTKKWQYFFSENSVKYWTVFLKSLQMLKIICYIFTIVFCIDYPEVQSFLLSFQSTFYLIYLWRYKPIKQSIDLRKLMIREICFIAITGTFLVYSFDLSSEKMLLFGWIHIYGFVTIMATQLLFDLFKQLKSVYNSYLRELRIKQLKQEAKYYNNPLQQFILIEHQNQQQFTLN